MKKFFTTISLLTILITITIAQTPFASYPLDGNANDVSGNALNGTITGSPVASPNRNNQANTCLNFNGSNDYIALPNDFDFPNRTISIWFNSSGFPVEYPVIYSSDHNGTINGQQKIVLWNDNGTYRILLKSDQIEYTASMNLNTWYHVVITRTAQQVKMFVNGSLVYTGTPSGNVHSNNGNAYATIGCNRNLGEKFQGKIDDLRIFSSELDETDIDIMYTSIKDYYNLDNTLKTYSDNGNIYFSVSYQQLANIKQAAIYDATGKLIEEVILNNGSN